MRLRHRQIQSAKALTVGWAPYVTKDYVWNRYYAYFMIFDLIFRRFYSIVRKGVEVSTDQVRASLPFVR
jgi:hypothetical protein